MLLGLVLEEEEERAMVLLHSAGAYALWSVSGSSMLQHSSHCGLFKNIE